LSCTTLGATAASEQQQPRHGGAEDFRIHPRPVVKPALDAENRLLLRLSDGPKQKQRLSGRPWRQTRSSACCRDGDRRVLMEAIASL
jgi:hypothetical protein